MFVILITYKKPLEIVDEYLADHTEFLQKGYEQNYFIVSGRKNPRTGGVIISQLKNRNKLEDILKHDPFYTHEIADYEIIEFIPGKNHPDFSPFIV
ncbi:MAG: YciI family protein [Gammaproteobacteria bacterium]|nr:YciI family protein [Gammaproteobacteria bacterium]